MAGNIWTAIPYAGSVIRLTVGLSEVNLKPDQARHLARCLYRAAREAEKRAERGEQ